MNTHNWIQETIKQSNGSLVSIVCPLFVNRVCSVYEERPLCCRSFPQSEGYCSSNHCGIALSGTSGSKVESSPACTNCQSKCCESILVPEKMELSQENILQWLDISCEDCRKIF